MRLPVTFLLLALLLTPAAMAQVPRGAIAEDCTATWCTYCPFAYQGLEVMKNRYDSNEFTSVRLYATSGGLGTAEVMNRINWYAISGYPTVYFDGGYPVVGGSDYIATGAAYDPIVSGEIARPSPLAIRIADVDLVQPDGSISIDVTVSETMADIGNMKIRTFIMENNLTYQGTTYTDVTRDILPDQALAVSQAGQVQHLSLNFAVDPTWKPNDLWAVVFIQDDDDKTIIQVESTRAKPAYSPRFWAKGPRSAVGPDLGAYQFEDFAVFNMGTSSDQITVQVETVGQTPGWLTMLTDGTTDFVSKTFTLAPGQSRILRMKVHANGPGYANVNALITSSHLIGWSRRIGYTLTSNNVKVLVVKDDGGDGFENYYIDALGAFPTTYGLWNVGYADVTAADLANFPVVIWECGMSYPTLGPADRAALGAYLDGGGKLFVNGQEIGWEVNDTGGDALAWYHQYLHANFVLDDTNVYTLTGVTGDPISNGMTLSIQGGDGANNQEYPDAIAPYDAAASIIFTYNTTYKGGLKVDTGVYKVVYLGFGYEAISTQANRRLLLARILQWFNVQPMDAPEAETRTVTTELRSFPNPTAGETAIHFSLAKAGAAEIRIYAPDGSLVRTLVDASRPAGEGSVRWDGRADNGTLAGSGVYLVRMNAGGVIRTEKVILTR
jgi:hypothetical protein